jgi:hypothetical protein
MTFKNKRIPFEKKISNNNSSVVGPFGIGTKGIASRHPQDQPEPQAPLVTSQAEKPKSIIESIGTKRQSNPSKKSKRVIIFDSDSSEDTIDDNDDNDDNGIIDYKSIIDDMPSESN